MTIWFFVSPLETKKLKKIQFKAIDRVTGKFNTNGVLKLNSIVVCATTKEIVFPRRIHKCEWEETFGGLFDRTVAMSGSTVVKTEISPSDICAHHIVDLDTPSHVCQQFSNLAVKDKIIFKNKFTVYSPLIGETRKWFVIGPLQN